VTKSPTTPRKTTLRKGSLIFYVRWFGLGAAFLWLLAVLMLVAVRWVNPPTTAVQIQRRLQGWIHSTPYHERYKFVPLNQISPDLQHAVIAAEDARFYQHHGFDWHAIQLAAEDDMEGGRLRGGSTLTQQLVKNLFFGTGRSMLRKGVEFTLVPVAELVIGKAAHSGALPQRSRMGSWNLRGRVGVPLLLPNLGPRYRPGTVSTARRDFAGSPKATA
jgi:monofunctional glycosyltransferase